MNALFAFAAGLIFGAGLILSGMTDPGKVIGFLDVTGDWDPSLAFVMGGAILIGFFAFRLAGKRAKSFVGGAMHLPHRRDIDKRLVSGSVLFGIGWGLAGFCPGPALVSFASGVDEAAIFVAAMLGGMFIYTAADRSRMCPAQVLRVSEPMMISPSPAHSYGGTTRLVDAGEPRRTRQARSNLEPWHGQ